MNADRADDGLMSVDEMIEAHEDWMVASGRYADTTVAAAVALLRRVHRELPWGLPGTREEILAWLGRPSWSRQTRKTRRDHLCRWSAWAAAGDDPWISADPLVGLPAPRVPAGEPRPAPTETVLAACTRTHRPWRLHCRLAAYAGLRPCEIARAHREHVTAEWVTIPRGKGGRGRRVPTHPQIWAEVEGLPPGPLTRHSDGRPATAGWVSVCTAGALRRRYGLPVALYELRHWYLTGCQETIGDARVTQELAGHASLSTTQRYTAVSDSRLRAAVAGLPV